MIDKPLPEIGSIVMCGGGLMTGNGEMIPCRVTGHDPWHRDATNKDAQVKRLFRKGGKYFRNWGNLMREPTEEEWIDITRRLLLGEEVE